MYYLFYIQVFVNLFDLFYNHVYFHKHLWIEYNASETKPMFERLGGCLL